MFDINGIELTADQVELWENAKTLINSVKIKAVEHNASIWFDGLIISPSDIVIDDFEIHVKKDHIIFSIFENDTSFDHGLFTPFDEFQTYVKNSFKILQEIEFT